MTLYREGEREPVEFVKMGAHIGVGYSEEPDPYIHEEKGSPPVVVICVAIVVL